MKLNYLIYLIIFAIFLPGCATTQCGEKNKCNSNSELYVTDLPTKFAIKGDFKFDAPKDWDIKDVPNKFKGHFDVDVESKVINKDPLRSDVKASVKLKMTNLDDTETYAEFNTSLTGQHDGPPARALTQILSQASATIGAVTPTIPIKNTKNENQNP